jgi:hypothetical protein
MSLLDIRMNPIASRLFEIEIWTIDETTKFLKNSYQPILNIKHIRQGVKIKNQDDIFLFLSDNKRLNELEKLIENDDINLTNARDKINKLIKNKKERIKKENDENLKEEMFDELHVNVICNNCLSSNFSGIRYICSECNNYNLCEDCKDNAVINHNPDHTFIQLHYQVLVDIQKYNSIFAPNKLLIKNKYEPFEIKVQIVNNGNTSLQGCFISQIRFGKKYLGCLKKTITTKCDTGDKVELDLLLKFEDDDEEEIEVLDSYEGYFRLMTEEGIPFGDILHIKLLIERE